MISSLCDSINCLPNIKFGAMLNHLSINSKILYIICFTMIKLITVNARLKVTKRRPTGARRTKSTVKRYTLTDADELVNIKRELYQVYQENIRLR